jgi:SNF2 family DNA or RNA helicase
MAYRLICIYETQEGLLPELRIEVCLETKSKSLSPFIRKISLDDLYRDGISTHPELLSLLNHAGLKHQPFRIDSRLLTNSHVVALLQDHPYNYIQPHGKGSAKKSMCPLNRILPSKDIHTGHMIGGELYIDNPNSWNRNMRVRIRYENALDSFFPKYSGIPYITHDGNIFTRDKNAENRLLQLLGSSYNPDNATLSFSNYDTVALEGLCSKGWKIYVANQQKSHSQVYAHHEPSGIVWFSNNQDTTNTDFSQQLLDGYLNSRNYVESDGNITIFKSKDVEKTDDKSLAQQIGVPSDAQQLYAGDIDLTEQEIDNITTLLNNRLLAKLRSYQQEGVIWLQKQRKNNHGCLLADEMGLGKTIQVIAHLCCLANHTHHLIIAPTSLTYNWKNEVIHFAPSLLPQLTFVSYDMLRIHLDDFINNAYDTIIIDEAQIIKNRQTKKYQAISQLQCKHKILLTGTPIENSIDELWSHFMMLMPQIAGIYNRLHTLGIPALHEVYIALSSKFLKPFILRRVKQTVLQDLPERMEKTIYLELSDQERAIYQRVHASILQAFTQGLSGRISSIALEGLLRLRQACVSPNLLPQTITGTYNSYSTKLQTALDYIELFRSEGRQVLVFSQFVSALNELEAMLSTASIPYASLYGNTRDRETPVQQFQTNSNITAFLISLKAGGVGLNLTAADRVILLDDWWNPAVEDQAMGRAHRIGQKHNVLVLRLVCKGTVEEKILQLQEQKRQTIDLFNTNKDKITLEEIKELISH